MAIFTSKYQKDHYNLPFCQNPWMLCPLSPSYPSKNVGSSQKLSRLTPLRAGALGDRVEPYHSLGSCLDILDLSFSSSMEWIFEQGLYRTKSGWRNFYWSCPRLMSQRVYGPYRVSKGRNHIFIVVACCWASFSFGIVLAPAIYECKKYYVLALFRCLPLKHHWSFK